MLKECPFCGGEARIFRGANENQHTIRCTQCAVKILTMLDEKNAIEAWNRRAAGKRDQEESNEA